MIILLLIISFENLSIDVSGVAAADIAAAAEKAEAACSAGGANSSSWQPGNMEKAQRKGFRCLTKSFLNCFDACLNACPLNFFDI